MFPVTLLLKLTCFTLFFSPSFSSRLFRGPHISREDESLTWKSYGRRSVFHVVRVYVCSPLSFWLLVPNKHHVLFCTNTHTDTKKTNRTQVCFCFLMASLFDTLKHWEMFAESLFASAPLSAIIRIFPATVKQKNTWLCLFFFWLIYLCLSSVFVYIFLKFSVALSHFTKLSRPSSDMSKMPFQFNCSRCKKEEEGNNVMNWSQLMQGLNVDWET